MTLESIEKLREFKLIGKQGVFCDSAWIADEIQAEIESRYKRLPVDADGVPIRFGDTVREVDDCVPMKVMSLTFYEDCVDVNTCGMNPKLLVHVKPRTVEDVLEEFVDDRDWEESPDSYKNIKRRLIAKYAAELRMADDVE